MERAGIAPRTTVGLSEGAVAADTLLEINEGIIYKFQFLNYIPTF